MSVRPPNAVCGVGPLSSEPGARGPRGGQDGHWIVTTWAWRALEGRVLTRSQGSALVPDDLEALDAGGSRRPCSSSKGCRTGPRDRLAGQPGLRVTPGGHPGARGHGLVRLRSAAPCGGGHWRHPGYLRRRQAAADDVKQPVSSHHHPPTVMPRGGRGRMVACPFSTRHHRSASPGQRASPVSAAYASTARAG